MALVPGEQPTGLQRVMAIADSGNGVSYVLPFESWFFINPDLTMGENIGDVSGLEVAYEAYKISLGGKPAPVIDGLTGDQRFFLAFAQAWRGEQRPEAVKTQVASNPHSPSRFRIIGPTRNLDAWYEAFKVEPGSKFYLPPEQRVRIW